MHTALVVLLMAGTDGWAQSSNTPCIDATTLEINGLKRLDGDADHLEPDSTIFFQPQFPSAGIFAVYASSPSTEGTHPRVAYLGDSCANGAVVHGYPIIYETPLGLLLRVTEPGTHYLSVSPEDPDLPLASYRLLTAFAADPIVPEERVSLGANPPSSCTADALPTFSPEPFSNDRFVELRREPGLTTKDVDPVECDVVSGGSESSGVLVLESDEPLQATVFAGTDCEPEDRQAEGMLGTNGAFVATPVYPGQYRLDLRLSQVGFPQAFGNAAYTVGVKYFALCALGEQDDRSDVPLCASPLEIGSDAVGTIGDLAREDEDYYTFTLNAQERVRIGVRSEERVSVSLFDEAGQRLASWVACRTGCTARLVRMLGKGRYFVSVGSTDASGGDYRVSIVHRMR